jgi:5'(3')-deoxyribonucleotidase
MYRIIIDQDSVLYDLSTPWYAQHNRDFPEHNLKVEDVYCWDTQQICNDNGCSANIYSYFDNPETWTDGSIIENSREITENWQKDLDVELGVMTTAANALSMPLKVQWLKANVPHIKNLCIVNGHIKHWIQGDILIDDYHKNLTEWQGIGILFSQEWNKDVDRLRANNWTHVDYLVRRSIQLLDEGLSHKAVELYLRSEQENI